MAALSEWLQLMLAEIARKGEDLERARAEEARRASEAAPDSVKDARASVKGARSAGSRGR